LFVDTNLIEWLLKNRTQYFIRQETGISQGSLSRLIRGESTIENLSVKNASKLTELAKKENNTASKE